MTTDTKNELKNVLEQDELDFLKGVLLQLKDNQTEIQDRLNKYRDSQSDMDMHLLFHELERMDERTEIMFNLAETLLNKAADNTSEALRLLYTNN